MNYIFFPNLLLYNCLVGLYAIRQVVGCWTLCVQCHRDIGTQCAFLKCRIKINLAPEFIYNFITFSILLLNLHFATHFIQGGQWAIRTLTYLLLYLLSWYRFKRGLEKFLWDVGVLITWRTVKVFRLRKTSSRWCILCDSVHTRRYLAGSGHRKMIYSDCEGMTMVLF